MDVEPPSWTAAAHARNLSSAALRLTYRLDIHGAHHLGTSGPLVIACPSESILAGAILQAIAPRPVHVIANSAMSRVLPARTLHAQGDIPVESEGAVSAQLQARAAIEDERAVAIAGSQVNPGYLVAITRAPVAAVIILGAEGSVVTDPPRPRSRISVFAFEPQSIEVPGDPLRPATRTVIDERIRQIVSDAEVEAVRRSGRLPVRMAGPAHV